MPDNQKYNPEIHHRRSIRLKEYDYSLAGAYFITICTQNRECLFGKIESGKMILTDQGRVILDCWCDLPNHYKNAELGELVIMPNHVHGIIVIGTNNVGAIHESPFTDSFLNEYEQNVNSRTLIKSRRKMILSKIIGRFKMVSSKHINENRFTPGIPVWQRNYYEHIIRDEKEMEHIREYIYSNPSNWENDKENPLFITYDT